MDVEYYFIIVLRIPYFVELANNSFSIIYVVS